MVRQVDLSEAKGSKYEFSLKLTCETTTNRRTLAERVAKETTDNNFKAAFEASGGASLKVWEAKAKATGEFHYHSAAFEQLQNQTEDSVSTETTISVEDRIDVGAGDAISIYQLRMTGPGFGGTLGVYRIVSQKEAPTGAEVLVELECVLDDPVKFPYPNCVVQLMDHRGRTYLMWSDPSHVLHELTGNTFSQCFSVTAPHHSELSRGTFEKYLKGEMIRPDGFYRTTEARDGRPWGTGVFRNACGSWQIVIGEHYACAAPAGLIPKPW